MKVTGLLLFILVIFPLTSSARSISDVKLEEIVKMNESTPELSLNGASLRKTYMIIDTYVGDLYLENKSHSEQDIPKSKNIHARDRHVFLTPTVCRNRPG
jgi:hypothetical protein